MPFSLFTRRGAVWLGCSLVVGSSAPVFGQTNYYAASGTEYAIVGSLPGDQMFPDAALSSSGGYLVWQDNITDGDSWGVSAMSLDGTLSGSGSSFRVNARGTGDQEHPRVALLKDGGAAFVWQGGIVGSQHIYARFLTSSNTWTSTNDLLVNKYTNNFQADPAIAVLNNSNVVVVYDSFNQVNSNSQLDVFSQLLTRTTPKPGVTAWTNLSTNIWVNQFTSYNQRNPAVAALKGGGFVVAWVSEQQRVVGDVPSDNTSVSQLMSMRPSVDIYARLYASNGVPAGGEFQVNNDNNIAGNPSVAPASDGGFMIAWGEQDGAVRESSWDIYARSYTAAGVGGTVRRVNTYTYGDQYVPRLSSLGTNYLAVWTSLGQDGSREGVYGQMLQADASPIGGEFRVNTTIISQQMQPAVACDGAGQFLAVWTSYTVGPNSFDLYAQVYVNTLQVLQPMNAPLVYAPFVLSNNVYQPQLVVSWAPLSRLPVAYYEVYVDGSTNPAAVTSSNVWVMTAANGLTASSTHSFKTDYVLTDSRRSPISLSASGTTWSGNNWGGVPWEWMAAYFGSNTNNWPAATADSDGDGMNNLQEFLAGTNPTNAASVLNVQSSRSSQGMFLIWNTTPGLTYQVQWTTNFTSWSDWGSPRYAADVSDSVYVGGGGVGFYRVVLLRQ